LSNRAAFRGDIRSRFSIANSQQVLPLAKVAFEPHAFGNPKGREQPTLDLGCRRDGWTKIVLAG
jgi:hypothetical protein